MTRRDRDATGAVLGRKFPTAEAPAQSLSFPPSTCQHGNRWPSGPAVSRSPEPDGGTYQESFLRFPAMGVIPCRVSQQPPIIPALDACPARRQAESALQV